MRTSALTRLAALSVFASIALMASALTQAHFASNSRLASGKWVKITISESGIYQLTYEQLAQMGFSNPAHVKVYGYGGGMLGENLNESLPDDLAQVPAVHTSNKLCFYGSGAINMKLAGTAALPQYTREFNAYSTTGHYFLTEEDSEAEPMTRIDYQAEAGNDVASSLDFHLHEKELTSLSFFGKELLGEDMTNGTTSFSYQLINLCEPSFVLTSTIAATVRYASSSAKDKSASIFSNYTCTLTSGGVTTNVPFSNTVISGSPKDYVYYNTSTQTAQVTIPGIQNDGYISYTVTSGNTNGLLKTAKLDKFIITYRHSNTLEGQQAHQLRLGFSQSSSDDRVVITDQNPNLMAWNVTNVQAPIALTTQVTEDGHTAFTPGSQSAPAVYVAFDPTQELLQIDKFESIENQNLHAAEVPHMLIITNETFYEQAERVAQLHRELDGMDVLVLDQEKIFNEFSSGNHDAMAYRLLCKMFYDRDPNHDRFQYLLLFGHGSFDNRGLSTGKQNTIIIYETNNSYDEDSGWATDDFFGFLDDNSGDRLSEAKLRLRVGRIPAATADEAKNDVDKLYEYVLTPDYGEWRNHYAVWAEEGNDDMHEYQAQGIDLLISDQCKTGMVGNNAFVSMYKKDLLTSKISTEARKHVQEMLNDGQYFVSYIGHANTSTLTLSYMWAKADVSNNSYTHFPIMTTACCDVARIDSDHRGIAEEMFHKRDGGAIALFTTARQVYATSNDELNRAWVKAMFSWDETHTMPTIGDVYMAAKLSYGNRSNSNKLQFLLLGDPAIKVRYPKPLFKIQKINNKVPGTNNISTAPLQELTIEAQVMNEDGITPNTSFNGEAYITIYDKNDSCKTTYQSTLNKTNPRTVYYPREALVKVQGTVVNGLLQATVVMPRHVRGVNNKNLLISVYAHDQATHEMVNGSYDNLMMGIYNTRTAVQDTEKPVIEALYLNDETSFATNAQTGSDAILYLRATDNVSFNTQLQPMGNGISVMLDGGKSTYNLAKNMVSVTDNGRTLNLVMPLNGLTAGRHTLTVNLGDIAGNHAMQTISFVVSAANDLTISTDSRASCTEATIDLSNYSLSEAPDVNLKISDIAGNIVWSKTTSSFPCTWNLTDDKGQRVKPGLYKIYGNYENEEGYGGTNIQNFIVLEPLKSNK